MIKGWENFYEVTGTAAAGLIGVMFVVTTLTAGLEHSRMSRGARVYLTPIVFHFSIIVILSAIALAPDLHPMGESAILGGCAVVGVVYSIVTTVRLFTLGEEFLADWEDRSFYGLAPTVAYGVLGFGAACVARSDPMAPHEIGGAVLVLLLISIRNAWDLATFLVMRPRGPPQSAAEPLEREPVGDAGEKLS
jgi:hypothetical protein